jgi:peptidoglycan/LPS O-acetylase OafA/YrhL
MPQPKRYDVLDGMRGVAAICVMVMHASGALGNSIIAVDLFFILSGFVIAHSYGGRVDMGLGKFMRRRLIRPYPMFLLGMALGWLSLAVAHHLGTTSISGREIAASVLTNALYLPYVAQQAIVPNLPIFPANPPAWSLFFELVANLFFLPLMKPGVSMQAPTIGADSKGNLARGAGHPGIA